MLYINGKPYVVRESNKPFANLEYTGKLDVHHAGCQGRRWSRIPLICLQRPTDDSQSACERLACTCTSWTCCVQQGTSGQ